LLLLTGLEKNGVDPSKVTIVNTPTNETPQVFEAKAVDAIGAWQPNSGQALKAVPGSKPVFTSADVPGFIAEPIAAVGARDISEFGGWRGWVAAMGA
jgi:NitT/TauT family transport system substrate-binding protein